VEWTIVPFSSIISSSLFKMPRRYLSSGTPRRFRRVRRSQSYPSTRMPLTNPHTGAALSRYGANDPYANRLYCIKQNLPDTYVASGTALVGTAYTYNVSALDNASGFASIFDQYRIDRIQVTFRPLNIATPLVNTATSGFIAPLIYSVVDYDDNSAPTAVAQLRDYQNCTSNLYETFTKDFHPHAAATVGGSSGMNVKSPWIDWAYPSIPHYGVKLVIQAGTAGFEQQWSVSVVMYISNRNIH
jgi:hypothetical protein